MASNRRAFRGWQLLPILLLLGLAVLLVGVTSAALPSSAWLTTKDGAGSSSGLNVAVTVTPTPTGPPCGGQAPGPWRTSTPGPAPGTYRMGAASPGLAAGSLGEFVFAYGGGTSATIGDNRMWRWYSAGEVWQQMASMPTAKQNIQGAYWNYKIYVPGGFTAAGHITENAIYTVTTNSWTTGAPMPTAKSPATAAYNGKIYAFGGEPGPTNDVFIYDIATDIWTAGAPMPLALTYGRAITLGNYIYYIGGIPTSGSSAAIYRYDPVGNSWTTMLTQLQTARSGEELMTDSTNIYIVGGATGTDYYVGLPLAQTVEIYNPTTGSISYGNPLVASFSSPGGGVAYYPGLYPKLIIYGGVNGSTYSTLSQTAQLLPGAACPTSTATVTSTSTVGVPSATRTPTRTNTATPTATATCSPSGSWSISPGTYPGVLYGVAAVSSNDVWAVGNYVAEHWNGSAWSSVTLPSPGVQIAFLYGVSAISSNDVWAVGYAEDDYTNTYWTLTEHWNGSAWSIVPSPNQGTSNISLQSVSAVSSNDVWAVGWYYANIGGYLYSRSLIEHWDGSTWSIVPSPNPRTDGNQLYGVAAISSNDVWAVGPGTMHWDGSQWSIVPSPGNSTLYGVAAVSSNDVWAVGYHLTEHWDGSTWSVVPSPTYDNLYGVAAVSSNDVWAVGWHTSGSYTRPGSIHWDGSTWSEVTMPSPGGLYNRLAGVAAVSSNDVWAVGDYYPSGSMLIEHYGTCPPVTVTGTPPTSTPTSTRTATPTSTPGCAPGPDYLIVQSTGATVIPARQRVPGSTCDSCTVNIALPFAYDFYGTQYSSVTASNKGNLQFGGSNSSGNNACLPTASISNSIMAYWDDLNTNIDDTMGIYTSVTGVAPNRIFNIEWHAGYRTSDARVDVEVRLYEGQPRFDIVYGTVNTRGSSTTVGVQQGTGPHYTQFECNTSNSISPGLLLTYDRRACQVGK